MLRMACKAVEPFVDDIYLLRRRVETFPDKYKKYENVKTVDNEITLRNTLTDRIPYNSYILCFDDDEIFFGNWSFTRYMLNNRNPDIGVVRNIELGGRIINRARFLFHTPDSLITDDVFVKNYAGGWIDNTSRYHKKTMVKVPLFFLHLSQLRPESYINARLQDYEDRPEMFAMPPSKRYKKHTRPIWMDYSFRYEEIIQEAIKESIKE